LSLATVILAAGQGTRMKSEVTKVLHPVGGKAMVLRAVDAAAHLSERLPVLVIGHGAESVRAAVGERAQFVIQAEQLGTGHAVLQTAGMLRGQADTVVVFYADMPLLRPETMLRLVDAQKRNRGPITLLTSVADDPRGFGRIVRGPDGTVTAIVEERECTPEQLLIRELNAGVYAFQGDWLWDQLPRVTPRSKGEYYLTDLVAQAVEQELPVIGIQSDDPDEVIGINTRVHLAEAEAALRRRIVQRWMLDGVTILDPATSIIHEDAVIGVDSVIYPNTHIWGRTVIGERCSIGPNSVVRDSTIGSDCVVNSSVIEQATLENHVDIGPFAHLRKGAYLAEGVHMGNFGEVKNSRLGPKTRMGHFSYVGDAEIGEDVNVGAGTITCNFDGEKKNKTVVGDHAFIGSDTMLVAPVTIGANARTGAGAVVTHDVPEGHVAVGVPARSRMMQPSDGAQEVEIVPLSVQEAGSEIQAAHEFTEEIRQELIVRAHQARQRAYAPYSHYLVGAALLASNGDIYLGCNVENAAYSPTCCAERVAIFNAVSEGTQNFDAIVVATSNGGLPCGVCRQVMNEFNPEIMVIAIDAENHVTFEGTLQELLPLGFGPEQLTGYAAS
jgi:bifunctional UDP-N-acetylglucosamine pyrophosphorylase/glucosamine-1-phosphate N-acetyltransferase